MQTFWNDVITKSRVPQPAVVFGGDFKCTEIQLAICFSVMPYNASRTTVQTCKSKDSQLHGDIALVVNAIAFQEESGFGKSYNPNAFSDAHDVVLVPLCLCNKGTHSSVAQPASNPRTGPGAQEEQPSCPVSTKPGPEEASASAAQPKKLEQLDKQKTSKASSAAQQVRQVEGQASSTVLQKEREQSKPNPNIRLSKQTPQRAHCKTINRELTQRAERADWIRKWISESRNNWCQLSWKDLSCR